MEGDEPVPDLTRMCSLWRQSQPSPKKSERISQTDYVGFPAQWTFWLDVVLSIPR